MCAEVSATVEDTTKRTQQCHWNARQHQSRQVCENLFPCEGMLLISITRTNLEYAISAVIERLNVASLQIPKASMLMILMWSLDSEIVDCRV